MSTTTGDKSADVTPSAPIQREALGDRGSYRKGLTARGWIMLSTAAVLVLALLGAGVWYGVSRDLGRGPNVFILASGSINPGHMTYQYNTFSGLAREKTNVTAGQTIRLSYTGHVSKGSLSFEVKSPVGISLWRVNVPENQDRSGSATIKAPRTGAYQVVVTGLDTGGKFDIAWGVK